MEIQIRYYAEQLSHSGKKYIISSQPDFVYGKILAELDTIEEVLAFGDKNTCVLKKMH